MSAEIKLISTLDVPTMQVSLRSDGLIQILPEPGCRIILPNVKLQIAAIGKLGDGKKFPVLILAGGDNSIDTEVMNFVALPSSNPFALAEAYVISNISHKLLANFYLKINRPARPTKVFTKEKDAISWLHQFLSWK
jgi:hypothetical protein